MALKETERMLETVSLPTEEEVGQRLQLLIFFIGDLNVCMHAYKKDLFARKKYETEFKS